MRRSYDNQFKIADVKLVLEDDMSVSDVVKEQIRFQYLKQNQGKYNIKKVCKTLNISRFVFYKFLNHKPSNRDIKNEVLKKEI
ncbi:hypothetical protein ACTQ4K_18935 [Clostridium sporogenes]|uniref:hypothetical protein n=1 Tax=Clostridium sporogenes TaxID=1509 RepID=UPI003F901E7D